MGHHAPCNDQEKRRSDFRLPLSLQVPDCTWQYKDTPTSGRGRAEGGPPSCGNPNPMSVSSFMKGKKKEKKKKKKKEKPCLKNSQPSLRLTPPPPLRAPHNSRWPSLHPFSYTHTHPYVNELRRWLFALCCQSIRTSVSFIEQVAFVYRFFFPADTCQRLGVSQQRPSSTITQRLVRDDCWYRYWLVYLIEAIPVNMIVIYFSWNTLQVHNDARSQLCTEEHGLFLS